MIDALSAAVGASALAPPPARPAHPARAAARRLLHPLSARGRGARRPPIRRSSRCSRASLPGMIALARADRRLRRPAARAGRPAAGAALGPGLVPAARRRRALRDRAQRRGRAGSSRSAPAIPPASWRRRSPTAGFDCAVTCIDPQPRADLGRLPVDAAPAPVRGADAALAGRARARRHPAGRFQPRRHARAATSTSLLNDVLPRLRPGVLVHLHDIFLPDAYPRPGRGAATTSRSPSRCLLQGGGYALRFASHYLRDPARPSGCATGVVGELPLAAGRASRAASGSRSCPPGRGWQRQSA